MILEHTKNNKNGKKKNLTSLIFSKKERNPLNNLYFILISRFVWTYWETVHGVQSITFGDQVKQSLPAVPLLRHRCLGDRSTEDIREWGPRTSRDQTSTHLIGWRNSVWTGTLEPTISWESHYNLVLKIECYWGKSCCTSKSIYKYILYTVIWRRHFIHLVTDMLYVCHFPITSSGFNIWRVIITLINNCNYSL